LTALLSGATDGCRWRIEPAFDATPLQRHAALIQFSAIGDAVRKRLRKGCPLNRPVNKRGPVKGENGEFEGLREANGLNLHG